MFTGIVEEIGKINIIKNTGGGKEICIESGLLIKDMNIGDSICVSGVCQTVEKISGLTFNVTAVEETLKKTNFGLLKTNMLINLESSLTLTKKISGHLVYGHIDCVGEILDIKEESVGYKLKIKFPNEYAKYVIYVGSVCLNGVSLTIAEFTSNSLTVAVIPHTWNYTTFKYNKPGDKLNIEFDVIGKYVDRINKVEKGSISEEWLKSKGF
ncbi:MAG: riboflavin synthase [bacterium]